jgi:hypothetical protein
MEGACKASLRENFLRRSALGGRDAVDKAVKVYFRHFGYSCDSHCDLRSFFSAGTVYV